VRAIATVEFEAEIQYLVDGWRRSVLAALPHPVTIEDPGHGLDEVSPVTVIGMRFNVDDQDDVAPFTPEQLRTRKEGGVVVEGTGFIAAELQPIGGPIVVSPGNPPELREDHRLDLLLVTPGRRGPALANSYAGALASLFRYVNVDPAESGIDSIRNLSPPPERPRPQGDDGDWRYDRFSIRLSRFYRAAGAGGA